MAEKRIKENIINMVKKFEKDAQMRKRDEEERAKRE